MGWKNSLIHIRTEWLFASYHDKQNSLGKITTTLKVVQDDLRGLFKPEWFCDTMINAELEYILSIFTEDNKLGRVVDSIKGRETL